MSSTAFITFEEDCGVTREQWEAFCITHEITYNPSVVGKNKFYAGLVEISFGHDDDTAASPPNYAEHVSFSTYYMGEALPRVAKLAYAFWLWFGGRMAAAPEIRMAILGEEETPK